MNDKPILERGGAQKSSHQLPSRLLPNNQAPISCQQKQSTQARSLKTSINDYKPQHFDETPFLMSRTLPDLAAISRYVREFSLFHRT